MIMPEAPPYISVLDELVVPNQPAKAEVTPPESTEQVVVKPEVKKDEKPPEVKPTEQQDRKATREPSTKEAKENFATLSEKVKAAEKKASDLEAQAAERQKKITEMELQLAELPPTKEAAAKLQQQIQEREEALQTIGEELQRSREELKAASLEKTPEFIEQFEKPREFQLGQLRDIAKSTGTLSESDVMRAVKDRNYEKLVEVRDQLAPHHQYRWDAILRTIEEIDLKKEQELADSEKAWERLEEGRRKLAMKSHAERLDAHRNIGAEIIKDMRDTVPFFREDKELQQQVSEIAEAVAGGKGSEEWDVKKLMGTAVAVPVLMRVNSAQGKMIDEQKAKIEEIEKALVERDKKIEDQEQFIKKKYGSVDFRQPATKEQNGDYDPEKPIHEQIAVRRN